MVWITGDTHFPHDFLKISLAIANKKIKPNDTVIICGDAGFVWEDNKKERRIINSLAHKYKNIQFLFVDGNHENFEAIYSYPIDTYCGGKVHKISKNIYHLIRGEIYTIEGKKIWVMGGAESIDKEWRVPNISWWKQEIPSVEEFDYGFTQLDKNNCKVDIVITHAAPLSLVPRILRASGNVFQTSKLKDPVSAYLEEIKTITKFNNWYFGHYHLDITLDGKFHCLYNSIVELK